MHPSKVSICLPNLNGMPYLSKQIDCILNQSFSDWELIVCDSYSDDGSWEFLQSKQDDSRIHLYQIPKEGVYSGWNECLSRAKGEYVYIATADDTMSQNLLEKMVAALERHVDCGLCQCALTVIGEDGEPLLGCDQWRSMRMAQYFGELLDKKHIRYAPHDGILHYGVRTVYTSITQLLIRRSVFKQIGLFRTDYGSIADFEWEMRASLRYNTLYIPDAFATWRLHSQQASVQKTTSAMLGQLLKMTRVARHDFDIADCTISKEPNWLRLEHIYAKDMLVRGLQERETRSQRLAYLLSTFMQYPRVVINYLSSKVISSHFDADMTVAAIGNEIAEMGMDENIRIVE